MRNFTYLFAATLGLALATALPASAQVDVTYGCGATPGTAAWPAGNPLWTFEFLRPAQSTGRDGSGLEIRNVFYNGHKVLSRAHTPVLNVEYEGSGCGCFRDWSDSEAGFAVTNASGCLAVANPGTVQTTCDLPAGGDAGSFRGVSFEEFPGELVVTSHMSAGWYRYRMKWHFYADGRIWPEYSFAAASATCTSQLHRHHVYWRFDFDLEGTPNDDIVTEFNPVLATQTTFTNEVNRTWGNPAHGVNWLVSDGTTGGAYRIIPSAEDLQLPIDPFSKTDALVLRYNASEIDDGGGGCAINYSSEQNGESIAGENIVFWYRSGASHTGGNPWECDIVGPTLHPEGAIPVELTSFTALLQPDGSARLNWSTSSETNNAGFDIEHLLGDEAEWRSVGYVEGHGTTTEVQNYAFTTDLLERGGIHQFRLKQVDFDGQFEYSQSVEVFIDVPGSYVLESAYPNPFNPSTTVRFSVAQSQNATITLYDALGRKVADLFDGYAEANRFESVRVDGSFLPSGTYTVRLEGENVVGTTRIVLIK